MSGRPVPLIQASAALDVAKNPVFDPYTVSALERDTLSQPEQRTHRLLLDSVLEVSRVTRLQLADGSSFPIGKGLRAPAEWSLAQNISPVIFRLVTATGCAGTGDRLAASGKCESDACQRCQVSEPRRRL